MFESLTGKLTDLLSQISSKGRLTDRNMDEALRQIRLALLEADVNFRVTRDFVSRIAERSVGSEVSESLSPGQQVVKIVHEELTNILGGGNHKLEPAKQLPTVVMLVGLQGSGKTTTAAKLALHLREQGQSSLLIANDLRRPAAIDQLVTLGEQLDLPVYHEPVSSNVLSVATSGIRRAKEQAFNWAIIDTSGRLQLDQEMMEELELVRSKVSADEVLLVVDAMTGQEAVNVASEFHSRVNLTGLILTKMDGDSRGGAALSITQVTGIPIKYIGVGEKADALEIFHPDRLASRILGMGDTLSLIEKAQRVVDEKQARVMEQKIRQSTFDLEDFLQQLKNVRNMGSLSSVLELIPGFSQMSKRLPMGGVNEKDMVKTEAVISSMTYAERRNPSILNGSRRRRIAIGSGTLPQDVNRVINQFRQTQKLMRQLAQGRKPGGIMDLLK